MPTIVIADDSFLMRKNLRTIFSQAGYDVVAEAGNGKAAVKAYKEYRPDIMTMDITMPVMSGIDAVKEITSEFPQAKIIMITALDQKHMVFQAISNGAKHYIMKPFNISQVLSVVKSVLEGDETKKTHTRALLGAQGGRPLHRGRQRAFGGEKPDPIARNRPRPLADRTLSDTLRSFRKPVRRDRCRKVGGNVKKD